MGIIMDIETKMCTWWLFWSDDDWPADGVITVEADNPESALEAGCVKMKDMAARGEAPRHWHWEFEPYDRKPNWLK